MKPDWPKQICFIFFMIGAFYMYPNHNYLAGSLIALTACICFRKGGE